MKFEGIKIRDQILNNVKNEINDNNFNPKLAVLWIGSNPVSKRYIRLKQKIFNKVAIRFKLYHFNESVKEIDIINKIKELNNNPDISGIMIQIPVSRKFDRDKLIKNIDPLKDVDGLRYCSNLTSFYMPPVVSAVIDALKLAKKNITKDKIILIGKGFLVGGPIHKYLKEKVKKITIIQRDTKDFKTKIKNADIIISAAGSPGIVKKEMVKDDVILIDVGTSELNGKLIGDIDPKAYNKASFYTPVPGSIGPVTVAKLLENVLSSYKYLHNKISLNKDIKLKKANVEDIKSFYKLLNDEVIRKFSFNPNPIKWTVHKKWFNEKINSKDYIILLAECYNQLIGYVRYEINNNEANISIGIAKPFRSKGVGKIILNKSLRFLKNHKKNIDIVTAFIKTDNLSSINYFKKNNFSFSKKIKINNFLSEKYVFNLNKLKVNKHNIIFLTNNKISERLIQWLKNTAKENIKIINNRLTSNEILNSNPNFIISYNYKHIITEDIISLMPKRIINLHISLLPWNKGAHPNLWSFLDNTPKGVTIHLINKGIDTGPILAQKEIHFNEEKETLTTTYNILHHEICNLFISKWDDIKNFRIKPITQTKRGTNHYKKEYEKIKELLGQKGWEINITEFKKLYNNLKK